MTQQIRTVARFATRDTSRLSVAERIELYTALAAVLPEKKERLAAERQAFLLHEAEEHQLSFLDLLNAPQD